MGSMRILQVTGKDIIFLTKVVSISLIFLADSATQRPYHPTCMYKYIIILVCVHVHVYIQVSVCLTSLCSVAMAQSKETCN